ncbi:hypothetical protein FNY09_08905 [Salmonella enterica]|uniref:Uncharacterized protein n=1 Tax=Salmonella enterica TaxID=28901 RepID=A0A613DUM9_SALER|nr:hypothetical protein [Salmonella enterica]EAT8440924.1 hypothetical protein [Salmonella enterica subsp. enterica serovar Bonariensis]EBL5850333.1 hypothetical protein [Salmonella enterica subsp. enterica serovar Muenchen]EBQ6116311.1 hypothetical protein [Salmonella enterica subsp. enterica serovar Praha]ECS9359827.1 hypothetical protein [Salmonella enterica subsp. enterica serovar Newport]EDU5726340.1 hypothetical protein [Salmonella enterica subsp. enterica serovar Typhimurium var. 5-]EE
MKKLFYIILLIPFFSLAFTKEGFYTIDSNGWVAKSTPAGDVFICNTCDNLVQVQISYGPEADVNAPFHNADQFVKAFDTQEKKNKFADMLIKSGIPAEGYDIKIIKVSDDYLGGSKAIMYSAIVKMPGDNASRETTLVTMHKNRLVKFSANFYENTLDEKSATAIDNLSKSLVFTKG